MNRLSRAGFKRDFAMSAVLPDWWDDDCAGDASLLPEIELRVARFLGAPIEVVRDARVPLSPRSYAGARLRRSPTLAQDSLGAAIHAGVAIAGAVVRSLRSAPSVHLPPQDALDWHRALTRHEHAVRLDDFARDLWARGIPIVPLERLPAPKFQGAACLVEGRPVVLIGHRYDEPGRVAFLVAHEVGHIVAGDCTPEGPVIDVEEATDDSEIERQADAYAAKVLLGSATAPEIDGQDFRQLARRAAAIELQTGAEASAVLFAWAARSGEYGKAVSAVKALYRASGARRSLRGLFDQHVDLSAASETDRELLRCVAGEPHPLAATG